METNRRSAKALVIDFALCAAWGVLAYFTLRNWVRTREANGLAMFLVNTTYAYFFVTRKASKDCSTLPMDWIVTALTILVSFNFRPLAGMSGVLPRVSVTLQTITVLALFASVLSLGRSFGLVPANRGIKVGGMYAYIRHPLYGTQLLFYCSFLLGNWSPRNAVILAAVFIGMNLRARAEERLLAKDEEYQTYLGQVRFRFIPGVI